MKMRFYRILCSAFLLCPLSLGCKQGADERSHSEPSRSEEANHNHADNARKPGSNRRAAAEPPSELGQSLTHGPQPLLWLQPADLMTSTGETPMRVLVANGGAPIDSSLLSAIAAAVELRKYPELTKVEIRTTTHNPPEATVPVYNPDKNVVPPPPTSADQPAYVEVEPVTKVPESWYVLSLSTIPAGVRVVPWSAPTPPAGVYAARFHTGSQPVLTRMLICRKEGGASKAIFEFSENLRMAEGGGIQGIQSIASVDQPATNKACTHVSSGPVPESAIRWVQLSCEGFSEAARWRIKLAPGLVSPSGVPVKTFAGLTTIQQELDLSTLPEANDGCRVWRP